MLKKVFVSPQTGKLGGVNLLEDPKSIGDGELVRAKNVYPVIPGVVSSRKGTQIGAGLVEGTVGNEWMQYPLAPPIHYVKSPATIGGDAIVISRGVQSVSAYSNTAVRVVDFASQTTLVSADMGVVTKRRPGNYFYDGKFYVFAGYGASSSGKIVQNTTGTPEVKDFTFINSPGVKPALAAQYRDRFVYGNFGPGYEHTIVFSDRFTRDTLPTNVLATNGRNFVIGSSDDGELVALVPVMLTAVGSPAQQGLLILHEYAAHLLTGEPNDSTDATAPLTGDVIIARISFNCGCASAESVVQTPYGVIWASHDDVWLFSAGQVPVRIGSKIRPALLQTPAALRYLWHATYFDGSYRLAVMSESQGANDDSPCGDQWWLDLRDGAPSNHQVAVWWGPQQYLVAGSWGTVTDIDVVEQGTRTMVIDNRPGMEPVLYGVNSTTGGLFPLTYDADVVRDCENDIEPELLQNSEITIEIVTKDYDYGDAEVDKIWNGLELSVWASYAEQLTVAALLDGGAANDTQDISVPPTTFITNIGTVE